jgi:hypothetical protein
VEVKIDRLLGRHVIAPDGRRVGRIEELRAHREGQGWAVTGFVIGAAGLWERLGLGARLVIGRGPRGRVAKWDQVLFEDDGPIRLTCDVSQLQTL